MIRNFWVKNYLSIGDKQELNFVAKGSASELVAEMPDGTCLYKLGVLYGSLECPIEVAWALTGSQGKAGQGCGIRTSLSRGV